jgi:hypothetical protein
MKSKKLPLHYSSENIHSAVQPSIKTFPEARSNYDSASAIELWLSVPRSLEVWLFDIPTPILKSKIERYVN